MTRSLCSAILACAALWGGCGDTSRPDPPPPDDAGSADAGPPPCTTPESRSRSGLPTPTRFDQLDAPNLRAFCTWLQLFYRDPPVCGGTTLSVSSCMSDFSRVVETEGFSCDVPVCQIEDCFVDQYVDPCCRPAACRPGDVCFASVTGVDLSMIDYCDGVSP